MLPGLRVLQRRLGIDSEFAVQGNILALAIDEHVLQRDDSKVEVASWSLQSSSSVGV
jgi:hypothetical protein